MKGQAPAGAGLVHITAHDGHRAEYAALFVELFGLNPTVGRIDYRLTKRLVQARRLLIASLDDDVAGFVKVAVLRAIRGKRTAAIFIRPQSCFQTGWKSRVKRLLFRGMCRIPGLSILSIVPDTLDPRLKVVTTGWIHDPQLWDRLDAPTPPLTAFTSAVVANAAGRPVLSYLGRVSTIKGFPLLVTLLEDSADLRANVLVVVAGIIDDSCIELAARAEVAGALVVDRFLDVDEMRGLYEVSDLIWCCYDSSYDQASGIFGRALQAGRCPVVREGAVISGYASLTGTPIIALSSSGDPAQLMTALCQRAVLADKRPVALLLHSWRRAAIRALKEAL